MYNLNTFGGELASTVDIKPQVHVEKVIILVKKLLQTCLLFQVVRYLNVETIWSLKNSSLLPGWSLSRSLAVCNEFNKRPVYEVLIGWPDVKKQGQFSWKIFIIQITKWFCEPKIKNFKPQSKTMVFPRVFAIFIFIYV